MPVNDRMIDHFVSYDVTVTTVDDSEVLLVSALAPEAPGFERSCTFNGRVHLAGTEHFIFFDGRNMFEEPAWRISGMQANGSDLRCTAWAEAIDPRSTFDEMTHVDPTGNQPLDVCPIHQL